MVQSLFYKPDKRMNVFVPSRGRPYSVVRLRDAFNETAGDPESISLIAVVDEDDPTIEGYYLSGVTVLEAPAGGTGIVRPLNYAFSVAPHRSITAFLGDDHIPRTPGWDLDVYGALSALKTGFCYGNDLLMGEKIPTAVFMTTDIPKALGHVALPALGHLFVDDYWLALGQGIGRIRYLPDTVIEHLHFLNGKSEMDETYKECNDQRLASADRIAFQNWKNSDSYREELDKLRGLL